jgi:hypothetical protein
MRRKRDKEATWGQIATQYRISAVLAEALDLRERQRIEGLKTLVKALFRLLLAAERRYGRLSPEEPQA